MSELKVGLTQELKLTTEKMIARIEGSIGWMIFNQPEKRNAVSIEMWAAVPDIIASFENDPQVRVIILAGAGDKAFVAGADISEFGENRHSPEATAKYDTVGGKAQAAIANATKPTIAMIQGFCVGGGVAISLNCDMRIASDDSQFGVPAAKLGLGYGARGLQQLIDLVGPSFAKEIFFTAQLFPAEDMLAMGLINRLVPQEKLEDYVSNYARMIGENAPLTVKAAKMTINELVKDESLRNLEKCESAISACFASADYKEGRTAFMEKRKPVFKGE